MPSQFSIKMIRQPTPTKKAVHLTSVHPPLDARIFWKEARTLADAGYEVVIVAGHPRDEIVDGIRIRSVVTASHRGGRMTRQVLSVLRAAIAEGADVYHFHDPELIPAGLFLRFLGKRVIYDIHESVPQQILSKHWIPVRLRRPISYIVGVTERIGARAFNACIAATPTIADRFPAWKTQTIRNFPIIDELTSPDATSYSLRTPSFAYVGHIGADRGIREMVRAVGNLTGKRGVTLYLAGRSVDAVLDTECPELPGWEQVVCLGWQSRAELSGLLGRVRAGLVVLHPIVNYLDAYPVKLFEYMAAGLPVIVSDFPLWRQIVEDAACGILVDPLNTRAISDAMTWILDNADEAEAMGRRGRTAIETCYNWENDAQRLLQLYESILNGNTMVSPNKH